MTLGAQCVRADHVLAKLLADVAQPSGLVEKLEKVPSPQFIASKNAGHNGRDSRSQKWLVRFSPKVRSGTASYSYTRRRANRA